MSDLDLLEYLAADHVNLREDITTSRASVAVEKHLTAERALLYPTIEACLANGRAVADQLREIDQKLVDALLRLERGASKVDAGVSAALDAHIEAQESRYQELHDAISADKLIELADGLALVMEEAPTHLHPHLPDRGHLREISSEMAATADHLRDEI